MPVMTPTGTITPAGVILSFNAANNANSVLKPNLFPRTASSTRRPIQPPPHLRPTQLFDESFAQSRASVDCSQNDLVSIR